MIYKKASLLQVSLVLSFVSTVASGKDDTSRDLKEVISELAELRDNITGFSKVSKEIGQGSQTTDADLAFVKAHDAASRSQWLTAQQEIQRYLTLSQKPDPQAWMKAQFILGRSYEERSQPARAARAYLRYLSAFITAKKTTYSEMGEVLERLVRAATKSGDRTKAELNQFLSSLAAMSLPEEMESELRYFTAVGSARAGQKNMALTWLDDLSHNASRPDQKARALNFRALMAMQDSKWIEAEVALQSIVSMDSLKTSAKEGARLSLARVYLRLKKPKTSLEIYESFGPNSTVYREALFEKTFVYIRQNEGSKARASAAEYLDKYPEHPDSMQMRSLRSWLEIHSGNLASAKNALEDTAKDLERIRTRIEENLSGKSELKHQDAKEIIALTRGLVTAPVDLEDTLSMFEQISDLEARLEEVNGTVLNILYTISKADLDRYKPTYANRMSQADALLSKHMTLSEKHVSIETQRLSEALTALDKQKLKASFVRRKNLFIQTARLTREAKRLIHWIGPAEQLAELARVWKRLEKSSTSGALQISASETEDDKATANQPSIAAANLKSDMLKTLTSIRREQVKNLVEQSKIQELHSVFQDFSASIHDDQTILSSYEPNESQTLDILDDSDSQNAWSQISVNANLLNRVIESIDTDANKDVSFTLAQIDSLLKVRESMTKSLADIRDVLEKKAGSASASILAHYDNVLGQRIARQQKWSGDVDYLVYSQKSKEHSDLKKAHDVELQVLSDNLTDIEQGAIKWQR